MRVQYQEIDISYVKGKIDIEFENCINESKIPPNLKTMAWILKGEIISFFSITVMSNKYDDSDVFVSLQFLYVSKKHRCKGIGKDIIKRLKEISSVIVVEIIDDQEYYPYFKKEIQEFYNKLEFNHCGSLKPLKRRECFIWKNKNTEYWNEPLNKFLDTLPQRYIRY